MTKDKKITAKVVRHYDPNTQTEQYILRAIKGEKLSIEDICEEATRGLTMHKLEGAMGVRLFIDTAMEKLTQGYIVSLGKLGELQPSVGARTCTDPSQFKNGDVLFRIKYNSSKEIDAAMKVSKVRISEETPSDNSHE